VHAPSGTSPAGSGRELDPPGIAGRVGIHTLRHSAASTLLDNGVHIRQVADILGHSSISVTGDIYSHPTSDSARRALETLSLPKAAPKK
jgi:site-specific recombinase XerD